MIRTKREIAHFAGGAAIMAGTALVCIGAIARCATDSQHTGVRTAVLKACVDSCAPRHMHDYNSVTGCSCESDPEAGAPSPGVVDDVLGSGKTLTPAPSPSTPAQVDQEGDE